MFAKIARAIAYAFVAVFTATIMALAGKKGGVMDRDWYDRRIPADEGEVGAGRPSTTQQTPTEE